MRVFSRRLGEGFRSRTRSILIQLSSRSFCAMGFSTAVLAVSAMGQQGAEPARPARSFGLHQHVLRGSVSSAPWFSWGPEDAALHLCIRGEGSGGGVALEQELILPQPIARPGAWLSSPGRRHLLLCGGAGRDGQIAWLERLDRGFALRELVNYRERDWIGCSYVDELQRLYMLDEREGAVLWAGYSFGAPLPRRWHKLVARSVEPALRRLDGCGIEAALVHRDVEIRIASWHPTTAARGCTVRIRHRADGAVACFVESGPAAGWQMAIADPARAGARALGVLGPSRVPCQILRLDGGLPSVIGVGRTDDRGWGRVELIERVALGAVYGVRPWGQPDWRGPVRIGHRVERAGDRLGIGYRFVAPVRERDALFVGGAVLLSVRGVHDGLVVRPARHRVRALLVVGTTGDPVASLPDGRRFLVGQTILQAELELGGLGREDLGGCRLAVPDRRELIGGALRYQFWVDVGTHWACTDIVTRLIRSDRFTSATWAPLLGVLSRNTRAGDPFGRHWTPPSTLEVARRSPAVRRWLRALGSAPPWN